jgi:hypothetical protein
MMEHPSVDGRHRDGRGGRPADEFFGGATARQKVRKKAIQAPNYDLAKHTAEAQYPGYRASVCTRLN